MPLKRVFGALTCHLLKAHLSCAAAKQSVEAQLRLVCKLGERLGNGGVVRDDAART